MTDAKDSPQRARELIELGVAFAEALRTTTPNAVACQACENRVDELSPLEPREISELIYYIADQCDQIDRRGPYARRAADDDEGRGQTFNWRRLPGHAAAAARRAEVAAEIEPLSRYRGGE